MRTLPRSLIASSFALLLVACGKPGTSQGGPCTSTSQCASGLVCTNGACVAAPGTDGGGTDGGGTDGGNPASVTWYRDVLPIVQDNCQNCHVPGGIAPFPLVTYMDGLHNNTLMAGAIQQGLMPPWKPAESCQSFQNDRSISQSQKDTIVNWSAEGAPAGNPADAPAPRDGGIPGLPRVDAQLDAGRDYTPMALQVQDDYHCSILDPGLTQQTDVIGVNILPGQPSLVHHVILFQATKASAQSLESSPGSGWTCFGGPGTSNGFDMVGGWVPGSPPQVFPAGTGVRIPVGNVIIMQVHYNLAAGAAQPDRTVAQLEYSPTPVPKPATIIGPIDTTFSVPPNDSSYSDSMTVTVPYTVTVWGVQPHMHTRGTTINVSMVPPGGQNTCLVDIPQWNFSWQQMYFYKAPITISAGTSLTVSCTWNNPTAQTLNFGESTSQEMCLAFFYATQ